MPNVNAQLLATMEALKADVIASMQKYNRIPSGNTLDAIEVVVNNGTVQLLAPWYIQMLETGRQPPRPDAPKSEPSLPERIKAWRQEKGIEENHAWPITQKIHKDSYPGSPGLLTEPLSDDNINRRLNEYMGSLALSAAAEVSRMIDELKYTAI